MGKLDLALFLLSIVQTVIADAEVTQVFEVPVDNGPLGKISIDKESGYLYVGGQNVLIQLYSNLSLISDVQVGPVNDNSNCYPEPEPCDQQREITNNRIHTLAINKNHNYILACGTANHGLCSAYTLGDISIRNHTLNPKEPTNNIIGSATGSSYSNSFAFYGSGNSKLVNRTELPVLYVAMGLANQSQQFTPAMISTREFSYLDKAWSMNYYLDSQTSSSFMDVHDAVRRKFRSYYIHGFEKENYVYFISVQMNDPTAFDASNNRFVTKIIRICKDDQTYSSYTELPMECTLRDKTYNIATGVTLSKYGYIPFFEYLYIAFGKQDNLDPSPERSEGSVLCMFEFNKIIEKFDLLQQNCLGAGIGNEVAWFVGKTLAEARDCIRDDKADQKNYCGGDKNLFGIQESKNPTHRKSQTLESTAIFDLQEAVLTSVEVVQQNTKKVAVLGTDDGHLLKVKVEQIVAGGGTPPPFMKYDITNDRNVKIQHDTVLDFSETSIYLLSGSKVTKFALDSCEVHTTCEQCVGVDPLGCGWCGDHCSSQGECTTGWMGQSCPPVIDTITPNAGPVDGGTVLSLIGRNFGTKFAEVREVFIGNDMCHIQSFSSSQITCVAKKMTSESQGQITVKVNDSSNTPYRISGEYTSPDLIFYYKRVSVDDFMPKLGPVSGGTKLVISGTNLNIGSNHTVQLAGQICQIESRVGIQQTSISCMTPQVSYNIGSRRRKRALTSPVYDVSILVDIDGYSSQLNGSFQYLKDSEITAISPHRSIQSGGTTVTVTGSNLHIVQEPQIVVKLAGTNLQTKPLACFNASIDGSQLVCPIPSITDLLDKNLPCCGYKQAFMSFLMDGIEALKNLPVDKAYLNYYTDPMFLQFTEDRQIKYFYITDKVVEIKGINLHYGLSDSDVTVTIGNDICDITLFRTDVLRCAPRNVPSSVGDTEKRRTVKITAGNLNFDIGELVYLELPSSAMSPGIIAMAVILALVVLCIIVLVIIMRRRQIGCFKKYKDKNGAQYSAGREVAFVGLDSAGQRVFDMENAQNAKDKDNISVKLSESKIEINDEQLDNDTDSAYAEQRMSGELAQGGSRSAIVLDDDTLLVLRDKKLLIEREWLTLGDIIGKGHFGCVYRGYLEVPNVKGSQLVAVKTLHQNEPRQIDVDSFIEEALRMKDFHHPNVLTLTGICFGMDDMPLVILPFMKHGDLLSYIRNEENNPTIKDLIIFGIDIARGMEYLSSSKFVHRDLAARNCMLDENFHAVVGDFGLSRDIYAKDYYASENKKTKLPVKWMAPECLEKGNYNSKSDVWSFGVVLWELMTRGVNPYPEVDNWDVLRYIKAGRRMPQPPFCPDILYKMMMKCWSFNPSDRPKFSELVHQVQEMITVLEQQMKQGQHTADITNTYVNTETCTDYHYHDNTNENEAMA